MIQMRQFWSQGSTTYATLFCRATNIAAVGTIFDFFCYDAVLAEIQTNYLYDKEQMNNLTSQSRYDLFVQMLRIPKINNDKYVLLMGYCVYNIIQAEQGLCFWG